MLAKPKTKETTMSKKAKDNIERRNFIMDGCRIEKRDDDVKTIIGHAAVFNELSENLGGFREMIKPGAFSDTIKTDDVRALFNHNPDHVLGRNKSGTLSMHEDGRGLAIEITPPDTQIGRDLIISMERGDITQMSFGFRVKAGGQDWSEDEEGTVIRTLTDLKLFDVSPVTFPAYPQTDVALRSLNEYKDEQDEFSKQERLTQMEMKERKLKLVELG